CRFHEFVWSAIDRTMSHFGNRALRHLPLQSGKSCVVAVHGDPFAAPLDCQRGVPGVGDARSSDIGLDTEPLEDVPMTLARLNNMTMRLAEQIIAERECFLDCARRRVETWIGCDSNDGAQRQGRNAEARLAVEDSVEPRVTDRMLRHVLPKRID